MPVAVNTTLAVLDRVSRYGLINFRKERAMAADFVQRLGTKTPTVDTSVGDLSGGNQQKVALARWLAAGPSAGGGASWSWSLTTPSSPPAGERA